MFLTQVVLNDLNCTQVYSAAVRHPGRDYAGDKWIHLLFVIGD